MDILAFLECTYCRSDLSVEGSTGHGGYNHRCEIKRVDGVEME